MSDIKIFFLQEIVTDLIDSDKSLVSPLMKLNYFGMRTKNIELTNFTTKEINGYKNGDENIPIFRYSRPKLIVTAQAHIHTHQKEMPISMLPSPFREQLSKYPMLEGIASLEKMALSIGIDNNSQQLYQKLPMEMLNYIQTPFQQMYKSDTYISVTEATLVKNGYIVIEIINNVRTNLLKFVVEIMETFGGEIEIDNFNKNQKENNQTINNYMSTTINTTGDGNIINTGNETKIESSITINKGDLKALQTELAKIGITKNDIDEISKIVKNGELDIQPKELSDKEKTWVTKAFLGLGKVATGISSNLIATMIKQYYGM